MGAKSKQESWVKGHTLKSTLDKDKRSWLEILEKIERKVYAICVVNYWLITFVKVIKVQL